MHCPVKLLIKNGCDCNKSIFVARSHRQFA